MNRNMFRLVMKSWNCSGLMIASMGKTQTNSFKNFRNISSISSISSFRNSRMSFSTSKAVSQSETQTSHASSTCWKCHGPVLSPSFPIICPKCQTLQKYTQEMIPDYFTLLGQSSTSYRVDTSSLSLNMKKLQRQLHPDLFSNKSSEEQELSQNLSSLVNQAIVTLLNPIQRGLYLLELKGIVLDLEKQMTMDKSFLGEVMELNEKLEEISNSQNWIDFREANEKELELLERKLTKAFERDNTKEAQLILSKMKYYENLQLKLKEIQSKFNVVD